MQFLGGTPTRSSPSFRNLRMRFGTKISHGSVPVANRRDWRVASFCLSCSLEGSRVEIASSFAVGSSSFDERVSSTLSRSSSDSRSLDAVDFETVT